MKGGAGERGRGGRGVRGTWGCGVGGEGRGGEGCGVGWGAGGGGRGGEGGEGGKTASRNDVQGTDATAGDGFAPLGPPLLPWESRMGRGQHTYPLFQN